MFSIKKTQVYILNITCNDILLTLKMYSLTMYFIIYCCVHIIINLPNVKRPLCVYFSLKSAQHNRHLLLDSAFMRISYFRIYFYRINRHKEMYSYIVLCKTILPYTSTNSLHYYSMCKGIS